MARRNDNDWDGLVIRIITKSKPQKHTQGKQGKRDDKKKPAPATQELEFPET